MHRCLKHPHIWMRTSFHRLKIAAHDPWSLSCARARAPRRRSARALYLGVLSRKGTSKPGQDLLRTESPRYRSRGRGSVLSYLLISFRGMMYPSWCSIESVHSIGLFIRWVCCVMPRGIRGTTDEACSCSKLYFRLPWRSLVASVHTYPVLDWYSWNLLNSLRRAYSDA